MRTLLGTFTALTGLLTAAVLLGQDGKQPPHPTPTDEHGFLRQFEGEWKTSGKGMDMTGKEIDMAGVEYDRMVLGDFWLSFVYRSQINDKPYVGHGMIGYDPAKKKYIGTWVDSMSPYMSQLEGQTDPKTNTLTLEVSGVDPMTEKPCKGRLVFQVQDPEHRSLQSFRMDDSAQGGSKKVFDLRYTKEQPHSK